MTNIYGTNSEDSLAFYLTIYHLTIQIPRGKLCTYGHLAYLAGKPTNSRQVGQALKLLPHNSQLPYNIDNVPWWRVLSAQGTVTNVSNKEAQVRKIQEEIGTDSTKYDLSEVGWFPEPEDVDLEFVTV